MYIYIYIVIIIIVIIHTYVFDFLSSPSAGGRRGPREYSVPFVIIIIIIIFNHSFSLMVLFNHYILHSIEHEYIYFRLLLD